MSLNHVSDGCDDERGSLPENTRTLYDQLLVDGKAWRAEQIAPRRLDDEIAALASTRVTSRPQGATDTRSDIQISAPDSPSRYPKGAFHMHSSRIRGGITAGAMVAVVALIAFLLINAAPGRGVQSPASHATGTSNTPSSSAPPVSIPAGRWVPQTRLNDTTNLSATGGSAIAPTDPRVVYEAVNVTSNAGSYSPSIKRTDDGGATWHALALPVPAADVNYVNLFVSPLDARTVWLQVSDQAATSCPDGESGMGDVSGSQMHGGILASGFGFCGMEWYSADAGQHWTPVKLSVSGLLSSTGLGSPGLAAQGSRLYTVSGCVSRICTRLLTSTDGGATWHTADSGLHTSSNTLCDFAPVAASAALYAITSAGDCTWLDTGARTLWRSDDAGVHWSQVAVLPFQNESGLQVVQSAGDAQPILYANMATKTGVTTDKVGNITPVWTDAATDLKYSTNGGKTWQAAPAAGVPSGLSPFSAPIATLSDGSVVWQFSRSSDDPTGASLYAWKAGDTAWRLLTPAVPSGFIETLTVVSRAGRGDQLWAVTREIPTTSGPITYRVVAFQL